MAPGACLSIGPELNPSLWAREWLPLFTTYVEDSVMISSGGDNSVLSMKYTREEQICEKNLLKSGLSSIDWKLGHVCLPEWVSHIVLDVVQIALGTVHDDESGHAHYDDECVVVVGESDRDGNLLTDPGREIPGQSGVGKVDRSFGKYCFVYRIFLVERVYVRICYEGHGDHYIEEIPHRAR